MFISLEGGEGSGKSTQAKLLAEKLQQAGLVCQLTREPGGEIGAEEIRRLLVEGESGRWGVISETLLFLAARVQHVERKIQPALQRGEWIVSDRFHDSTRVYQGVGKGLADNYYAMLHNLTLGNFFPALTFVCDIPVEAGLKRAFARNNQETRFENMDINFHQQVRQGFLDIAAAEPQRVVVLDAQQDIATIHQQICAEIRRRYGVLI